MTFEEIQKELTVIEVLLWGKKSSIEIQTDENPAIVRSLRREEIEKLEERKNELKKELDKIDS